ncbi:MAG: TIGR01777 family oxidoreductase [Bacteroidota bacterium]
MKIILTGKTGFIGSFLSDYFTQKGYEVSGIGRKDFRLGEEHLAGLIDGNDVLIHLAGAPVIKRWTRRYTRVIWSSRVDTTGMLTGALKLLRTRPKIFISSSAVGIYTDEGHHTEENHQLSDDFLGTLCQRWEEEAKKAAFMLPVYTLRTGIVLGKEGGALPQMSLPFKLGVGGKIGSGKQGLSWIHILDYARALEMIIEKQPSQTIFNFTAPHPVSNAEFSKTLAKTLGKPNLFTVPGFALRILYGKGASTLLGGQFAYPENLEKAGYEFQFPSLKQALEDLL